MEGTFGGGYDGLTVLVTGHTGFKGSWLSIWLRELGARVIGYSLAPPTSPSNYALCHLDEHVIDVRADVRNFEMLSRTTQEYRPQVVFHLAAQPLVPRSYREPRETFGVNAQGTVNVLEAVRAAPSVRAVVCITTDKVYRNQRWLWGYREIDALGGHDPYSASKAMAELAIESYQASFFPVDRHAEHRVAVASARAGNVIGGGDWGACRLMPDLIRGFVAGQEMVLYNPDHVRPWQFLLEPLAGYLWLGANLLRAEGHLYAEAWNFGPLEQRGVTTEEFVRKAIALWGSGSYVVGQGQRGAETQVLRLDWDKAANRLAWRSLYTWEEALGETVSWYKVHCERSDRVEVVDMHDVCVSQIETYTEQARRAGLPWAQGDS
jgi:CDP-glucose 4,6-dehydratase